MVVPNRGGDIVAIKVFPSANGVGGAGQKVYSETNMVRWMQAAAPRNYVVNGLGLSGVGTGTLTISPGSAMIAGQLVTVPEAVALSVSGTTFLSCRLSLTRDSLGNADGAAATVVYHTAPLTEDDTHLGFVSVSLGAISHVNYLERRASSPYGTAADEWLSGMVEYDTLFDSLDGLTTDGSVTLSKSGYVTLTTAAASGASASMIKYSSSYSTARKRPDFYLEQWLATELRYAGHAEFGYSEVWAIVGAPGVKRHVGFVIIDGKTYGTVGNGSVETRTSQIDLSNSNVLVAHYAPGQYAEFWTNTTHDAITTGLPSGDESAAADRAVMYVSVKTAEARAKDVGLSRWKWRQQPV